MFDNETKVIEADIDEILPNRFQPRIQFDEEEILELSDSIREHGIIQPLVVRTIGDKYEIIAGERRYKACVLAGKETVPIIIKNLNDKDSAEIALIENIQRKNLTAIEEALSYKKILDMGYLTQEQLANKLGKSQSAVANKIRLLNLSDDVQEALLENKISERHARSLLRLKTNKEQNQMLDRIINERLTVRRTDEEIEKIKDTEVVSNINEEKEGKGEINMNNNINPSFDIFGTNKDQSVQQPTLNVVPSMPVVEPVQSQVEQPIFNMNLEMPSVPNMQPVEPVQPQVEPSMFNMNLEVPSVQNVQPVEPVQPQVEQPIFNMNLEMPSVQNVQPVEPVQPQVEQPMFNMNLEMPSVQNVQPVESVQPQVEPSIFNMNLEVPSIASEPTVESIPAMDSGFSGYVEPQVETEIFNGNSSIPTTSPIVEQANQVSNDLFSFNSNTSFESSTPENIKMPEPIIITDYEKQYDPIMPISQQNLTPKVDFKEVITAIRECSSKIEQYGFKIEVEEYDLANFYQVIFKIEK